jgi:hypothetical protein
VESELPVRTSGKLLYGLVGVPLLAILGYATYVFVVPPRSSIRINANCTVTPDVPEGPNEARVKMDSILRWNPPSSSRTYGADFHTRSPLQGTTFADAGKDYSVVGDQNCNRLSVYDTIMNQKYCHFPYDLTKDSPHNPCGDPGVHVVPPNRSFLDRLFHSEH